MKPKFFLLAIFLSLAACHTSTGYIRPNILFIMVDDLGKEWISCYGAADILTPNIDQLAANGMKFNHAYSMPQCTPTRLTLMTGQYPFRHGWVNHWDVPRWGGGCHFDWTKYPGLARILQSGGYTTAAAGKWQVNDFRVQPDAMTQHGFDDYCMWTGYETGIPASAERYWNPYLFTKSGSKTYEGQFGTDVLTDFLIGFMKENKEKSMFLYFPMALTHPPMVSTPDEPNLSEDLLVRHKAMVRYMDKMVGKLVHALKELDLYQNTLIFFTTDNGTSRGIKGTRNGYEIEGGKGQTMESGICQPFIVSGLGKVASGVETDALIDFTDLLPTFADLAGIPISDDLQLDGRSFAPVLLGKTNISARKWIMAMGGQNRARLTEQGVENEYYFRDRVLRNERFKVYVNPQRKIDQCYDLVQDPLETENLIGRETDEVINAVEVFEEVIEGFPEKDNDPIYDPLPAQEWDVDITANSQVWKTGYHR